MAQERTSTHQRFADILRREDLDEFFATAKQVRELKEHPGFRYLMDVLKRKEDRLLSRLVLTERDHVEMVGITGEVVGVRESRELIDTVLFLAEQAEASIQAAVAARETEESYRG